MNNEDDETDWDDMEFSEFVSSHNIEYFKKGCVPSGRNLIKLQNNRGYISKRGKNCIIRYFLKYDNEEEYFRALCILFLPFRNERQDIHNKDVKMLYLENEERIEATRNRFEKHKHIVDIIREAEKTIEASECLEENDEDENEYKKFSLETDD